MATLAEVRGRVRLRLEAVTTGTWSDAQIDEAITATLDEYNLLYQREAVATAAVVSGTRETPEPAGAVAVLAVIRDNGEVIPLRGSPEGPTSDERLAWERFAGSLRFTQPLGDETLTIWYATPHALGDVPAADVSLLVAGGVYRALQERWAREARRGDGRDLPGLVREARHEYLTMLRARGRRMRVGTVRQ